MSIAKRLGFEDRARLLRLALGSPIEVRNRRDDAALRVLMSSVLNRDSNCVDVGAYRGKFVKEMVRLAPEGRHIAYEPMPEYQADLTKRFPQVDVRQKALYNRTGVTDFLIDTEDPACSALPWSPPTPQTAHFNEVRDGRPMKSIESEVERLDDAIPPDLRIDFIKIDVEGSEYQVLEGALRTLCTHQPVVAFEHGHRCQLYGAEPGAVHDLLTTEAGLRIFDIDGGGPYDRAGLADEMRRRWFFFART
jgi:FkbM family methyltransferase